MNKEIQNIFLFIGICIVLYLLFRYFNLNREGLENTADSVKTGDSRTNGIAGNAAAYAASIKEASIKLQDTFLISKYRTDYENIILNLDELLNNLMLNATLTIDKDKPGEGLKKLGEMNMAKVALNNVMKFVDASK